MTWMLMEHTTVCNKECDCLVMICGERENAETLAQRRNNEEHTNKYFAKLGEMFDTKGN